MISKIFYIFYISSQSSPKEVPFVILAIPLVGCTLVIRVSCPSCLHLHRLSFLFTPPPLVLSRQNHTVLLINACLFFSLSLPGISLPALSPFYFFQLYHRFPLTWQRTSVSLSPCCTIIFLCVDLTKGFVSSLSPCCTIILLCMTSKQLCYLLSPPLHCEMIGS